MTIPDDAFNSTEREPDRVFQRVTFRMVPDWLMDSDLSDGAFRTYAYLVRYANQQSRAWPSQDTLAKAMRRGERTVRGYLAELKAIGAIRPYQRRFGSSTVWEVAFEKPLVENSPAGSSRMVRQDQAVYSGENKPPNENQVTTTKVNDNQSLTMASTKQKEPTEESQSQELTLIPLEAVVKKQRPKDDLWDSLMHVCQIDQSVITSHARGGYNKAVSELRKVGATSEEIYAKATAYRMTYPKLPVTPSALVKHWPALEGHMNRPELNPNTLAIAKIKAQIERESR